MWQILLLTAGFLVLVAVSVACVLFVNKAREDSGWVVHTVEIVFGKDGSGIDHKGRALLILLDLNLPDMTGIEILRQVKQNKYLKSTPVVVLTTTDDSHEIKRCYEFGCNVYITKPVNYESFANAIRQLGLFFSVIQVPPAI
jgi:CheY-like chemotaxis protein